jgi:nucleotide-binding universal stress UspA family protein
MALDVILVGTDFGPQSRHALDWAIELAHRLGSRIVVAHAFDLPIYGLPDATLLVDAKTASRLSTEAQNGLDAEVSRVRSRGVTIEGELVQGDARQAIPSLATRLGAGLIVVGTHGRHGVARALLGSVAGSIVRAATMPVVVVPQAQHAAQGS